MKDNGFDFNECKFIDKEMKFIFFLDFYRNCQAIKRMYKNDLSLNGKIFYKWYIYANTHTSLGQKNKMWDYLNDYCEKEDLKYYINL